MLEPTAALQEEDGERDEAIFPGFTGWQQDDDEAVEGEDDYEGFDFDVDINRCADSNEAPKQAGGEGVGAMGMITGLSRLANDAERGIDAGNVVGDAGVGGADESGDLSFDLGPWLDQGWTPPQVEPFNPDHTRSPSRLHLTLSPAHAMHDQHGTLNFNPTATIATTSPATRQTPAAVADPNVPEWINGGEEAEKEQQKEVQAEEEGEKAEEEVSMEMLLQLAAEMDWAATTPTRGDFQPQNQVQGQGGDEQQITQGHQVEAVMEEVAVDQHGWDDGGGGEMEGFGGFGGEEGGWSGEEDLQSDPSTIGEPLLRSEPVSVGSDNRNNGNINAGATPRSARPFSRKQHSSTLLGKDLVSMLQTEGMNLDMPIFPAFPTPGTTQNKKIGPTSPFGKNHLGSLGPRGNKLSVRTESFEFFAGSEGGSLGMFSKGLLEGGGEAARERTRERMVKKRRLPRKQGWVSTKDVITPTPNPNPYLALAELQEPPSPLNSVFKHEAEEEAEEEPETSASILLSRPSEKYPDESIILFKAVLGSKISVPWEKVGGCVGEERVDGWGLWERLERRVKRKGREKKGEITADMKRSINVSYLTLAFEQNRK